MPRPKKKLPLLTPDTPSAQLLAEKPKTPASAIPKATLFDDSDSDAEFHSAVQSPAQGTFKVNEAYARRFEHNKKREELHRLEEKYGKDVAATKSQKRGRDADDVSGSDSDDSSSEDEDEVAVLATETLDQQIMATIEAIRKKDPRVYDKDAQFYDPIDAPADETAAQKKEKPMFLRDYHRENLLAGHTGGEDDQDTPLTFAQQQEDLKRTVVKEMHAAAEEDDDDEEAFIVRKEKPQKVKDVVVDLPDPSTADPANPDEYLTKFLASRAWAKASGSGYVPLEDDDTESEAEAEQFEYNFNMRFEDPDAAARAKLATYGRDAVNAQSVRREEKSKRKRAREEKRKRKEEEKAQRDEEKRRLKKLKTEEMMEKFKKVREAAGLEQVDEETETELFNKLLEGDFSDGEWDEWMQQRFGDEYYGAKDPMKKPEFDDDIDIKDLVPDFSDDAVGEDDEEVEEEAAEEAPEEVEDEDEAPEHLPQKRKTKKDLIREKQERKQKDKQLRRKLERFIDDNFDVDDKIGGAKSSGFRYRETTPETYGLTPLDILAAPDAELNNFAGLKKYAAFRDPEKKERDRKRLAKKKRLKQWRKEVFGDPQGITMPADWKPEGLVTTKKEEKAEGESNIIEADGERKKKRRKKNKSKA